jgi:hypothetical protein
MRLFLIKKILGKCLCTGREYIYGTVVHRPTAVNPSANEHVTFLTTCFSAGCTARLHSARFVVTDVVAGQVRDYFLA